MWTTYEPYLLSERFQFGESLRRASKRAEFGQTFFNTVSLLHQTSTYLLCHYIFSAEASPCLPQHHCGNIFVGVSVSVTLLPLYYSTQQKSWVTPHYFIFCFQRARVSCNLLQWSWAIVLFLDIGCFFTHFQSRPCTWPFLEYFFFGLLSHLTLTFESYKHRNAT